MRKTARLDAKFCLCYLQEALANGHDASPEGDAAPAVNGHKEEVNGVKEELVNGVNGHHEEVNGVKEELTNGHKEEVNGVEEAAVNGVKDAESTPASPSEEVKVNGDAEHVNGEANGDATEEEVKKDKKDKSKKKKKWSFRSISFSKKDKSKPTREEKSEEIAEVSVLSLAGQGGFTLFWQCGGRPL